MVVSIHLGRLCNLFHLLVHSDSLSLWRAVEELAHWAANIPQKRSVGVVIGVAMLSRCCYGHRSRPSACASLQANEASDFSPSAQLLAASRSEEFGRPDAGESNEDLDELLCATSSVSTGLQSTAAQELVSQDVAGLLIDTNLRQRHYIDVVEYEDTATTMSKKAYRNPVVPCNKHRGVFATFLQNRLIATSSDIHAHQMHSPDTQACLLSGQFIPGHLSPLPVRHSRTLVRAVLGEPQRFALRILQQRHVSRIRRPPDSLLWMKAMEA